MDWNVSLAESVSLGRLPNSVISELEKGDFFAAESFCCDFKRDGYGSDANALAEAVKDIAAFHNAYGGFIVFGVEEVERDIRFRVVGLNGAPFDMQLLRGKIESWLMRSISISYHEITVASRQIGVLHVPKRPRSEVPNAFQRKGPEIKPGKFFFDAGQFAVRRDDKSTIATELVDFQLALGPRELDALGVSIGRVVSDRQSGVALDNNMPSRSVICSNFVGRTGDLTHLWSWLQDDFQFAKVIAGEGGKGKTSLAYEFATQVAYQAPLNISRIVWLTAKRQQFSGIENLWKEMPETHFQCFSTLLIAIGRHVALTDSELNSATQAELRLMVRTAIGLQPTLFVLDDIDSLSPDDQRRALEFAQQAGSARVRFLLTTRSNASYSSDAALTISGLEGREYSDLVSVLAGRYGVSLPSKGEDQLHAATQGSPLLTDSILRVMRRGNNLRKAIEEWKGHSGEDARNAVLGREIEQLSREAKRALLCLAFLGECSKTELMSISGLLELRLEDALEELRSLFIVSAPQIIESEPRFQIGLTAALLVVSKRSDLAADHAALERAVKGLRAKASEGVANKQNHHVGRAISQALALVRTGDRPKALQTIDAALKAQRNHVDLLVFKARLLCDGVPPDFSGARALLVDAYRGGARKPILFDLWYKCERELGFGPGVIEAATSALREFPSEESVWAQRRAEGYVLNGLARKRNREIGQAYGELSNAAQELYHACMKASDTEMRRIREFLYGVHDQLLALVPAASAELRSDPVSLVREVLERGDQRLSVALALASAVIDATSDAIRRPGPRDSQRARLEQNRAFAADVLRAKGGGGAELLRQLESLPSLR